MIKSRGKIKKIDKRKISCPDILYSFTEKSDAIEKAYDFLFTSLLQAKKSLIKDGNNQTNSDICESVNCEAGGRRDSQKSDIAL